MKQVAGWRRNECRLAVDSFLHVEYHLRAAPPGGHSLAERSPFVSYPATFDIQMPKEFDKAQVVLRILIVLVLVLLQIGNFLLAGAYLFLPIVAAVMISQNGPQQYLDEAQAGPVKWLRYIMMIYAYMALATDKLPTEDPEEVVQLNVTATGSPSVGQALLRIILAIPHAIVLGLIGIAFFVVWIVAAVSIFMNGSYPQWAADFIRGYLRWNARLLAYMASLVDEYPPFSFSNGSLPELPAPQ